MVVSRIQKPVTASTEPTPLPVAIDAAASPPAHGSIRLFVHGVAALVTLITALDLVGWVRHMPRLTSLLPGYATMKPNTAIALLGLALALWAKRSVPTARRSSQLQAAIGDALALAVMVLAAATLIEYIGHIDLHIDNAFYPVAPDVMGPAGRPAAGTAFALILISVALYFLDLSRAVSIAADFFACIVALSALVGFVFDAGPLFGVPLLRSSAVHTAGTLFLLGLACFAARPNREPLLAILSTGRHRLTRTWYFFGTCALPFLISFPILLPLRHGWYDAAFSFALLVVVLIAMQSVLIWKNSHSLMQLEAKRLVTERALIQNEKLAVTGRLAASIAHEINNPLESVTNLLYIARNSSEVVDIHAHLDTAERELRRIALITQQTLQFNRQSTHARPVTADELLDGILAMHHGRIVNSHVEVVRRHRTTRPVTCYDSEIRQVLSNLIGNAIDAMHPAGGRLLLRSREATAPAAGGVASLRRAGLLITVADTGPGMAAAIATRVFEPFFTTKGIGGTGLGLWICREIVDRHRGALRMRSSQAAPHHGTVFSIFLPFEAATR